MRLPRTFMGFDGTSTRLVFHGSRMGRAWDFHGVSVVLPRNFLRLAWDPHMSALPWNAHGACVQRKYGTPPVEHQGAHAEGREAGDMKTPLHRCV